ncbi:MAG: hypothetical protein ACERKX_12045 [Anaerolineales bacterium]
MTKTLGNSICFLLLLSMMVGIVPACGPSSVSSDRSMENAMLLALASHEQLELGQRDDLSLRTSGNHSMKTVAKPSIAGKSNPHEQLVEIYAKFARSQSEGSVTQKYFEDKATEHALLSQALTNVRAKNARRRGRGFQRFIRRLTRAPVNVSKGVARGVGKLLKGTLRVTGTIIAVAVEQIPRLARDYVMQKLRDLRDLAQGRINLTWDKIAEKIGLPFAIWLRSRIDPAFVRLRDRVVARALKRDRKPDVIVGNDEDKSIGEIDQNDVEIGYGNWQVDLITDEENCGGTFEWVDYWQNLPKNDRDDCQPALDSTHHVDVWIDSNVSIPLTFELDSGKLKGGFETNSFDDITAYQTAEGSISAEIVDGWVRPRPDNHGWEFGGSMSVEVQAAVELRCWYNPEDPQTPGYFYWINDDKTITVETPFTGQTDQFYESVDEGDPGVTSTGGTIDLYVGELSSQAWQGGQQLLVLCESRDLPGKFPPPFLGEIGD